jgi:hypothetical protein
MFEVNSTTLSQTIANACTKKKSLPKQVVPVPVSIALAALQGTSEIGGKTILWTMFSLLHSGKNALKSGAKTTACAVGILFFPIVTVAHPPAGYKIAEKLYLIPENNILRNIFQNCIMAAYQRVSSSKAKEAVYEVKENCYPRFRALRLVYVTPFATLEMALNAILGLVDDLAGTSFSFCKGALKTITCFAGAIVLPAIAAQNRARCSSTAWALGLIYTNAIKP